MVVDDEGGAGEGGARRFSGMAGLLDAGIISEALPAPSHRVQAWDFTTGNTPEISDSMTLYFLLHYFKIFAHPNVGFFTTDIFK